MLQNPLFRSGRMQLDYDHVETRGVLAGAYVDDHSPSMLRHLVFVGEGPRYEELRTGCRQPVDHVVDVYGHSQAELASRPTCPTCAKKWEKIPAELRGAPEERFREPNGGEIVAVEELTVGDVILRSIHDPSYKVRIVRGPYSAKERWGSPLVAFDAEIIEGPDRVGEVGQMKFGSGGVVKRLGAQTPNGGYYVWVLGEHGEPLLEGPYGPHELERAKALARIGATEGEHDRAVSKGVTPTAESFEIVRRYKAGSGERVI